MERALGGCDDAVLSWRQGSFNQRRTGHAQHKHTQNMITSVPGSTELTEDPPTSRERRATYNRVNLRAGADSVCNWVHANSNPIFYREIRNISRNLRNGACSFFKNEDLFFFERPGTTILLLNCCMACVTRTDITDPASKLTAKTTFVYSFVAHEARNACVD